MTRLASSSLNTYSKVNNLFSNNFGLRSLNRQRQLRLQLHKIISAPPSQHWWSVSFILTFSLSLCIVSITFRIFQWEIDWSHYTGWLIDRSTGTCILIVLKLCLRFSQFHFNLKQFENILTERRVLGDYLRDLIILSYWFL